MSTTTKEDRSDAYACNFSTDEISRKLRDKVFEHLRDGENALIQAPTSIGKSHLISTTAWRDLCEITGSSQVVHISQTTVARDEAAVNSEKAGLDYVVLRGRDELCDVAAGRYDDILPKIEGLAPSAWFNKKCDAENIHFFQTHGYLNEKLGPLPCCQSEECPATEQFSQLEGAEGEGSDLDIVHMTANFSHVSTAVDGNNVIFDERPDFEIQIPQDTVRRVVTRVLNESSGKYRWEGLLEAVQRQDEEELKRYQSVINDSSYTWYAGDEHVHTLALPIARAILMSKPYYDDRLYVGWCGRIGVVLDDENTIQTVYHRPDLSEARCIIGLDAHPSPLRWELNTGIRFPVDRILTRSDENAWRRTQRGLSIIQVGNSVRSYTQGWRGKTAETQAKAVIQEIREKHGEEFRSCICPKSIEEDVVDLMRETGIEDPKTAHYGEIKSMNSFADESVGLVLGCIDPGDHNVMYMAGLLGLDTKPEMYETEEGELKRVYGRRFVGPNADGAKELLESVRADGVAQAAGRYARNSRDPGSSAIVYVMTTVLPDELVDGTAPGFVTRKGDKRQDIEQFVQEVGEKVTGKMVVEAVDSSKKHALEVLNRMADQGLVDKSDGTGAYGADEFEFTSGYLSPVVDLEIKPTQ